MRGGGGCQDRGGIRGLRRAGARSRPPTGPGSSSARQPERAQGREGARAGGGARLCELLFLPAYSPDFSPIEEAFSKEVKALLRREKARTREALIGAIGRALDVVSGRDARGFFVHCGYPPRAQLP